MSDTPAAPATAGRATRWRALLAPRWLGWHLFAVATVAGMLWLGDWQLRRALGGNALSWAYTFEWPVFAVLGVVFWVKTVRDELAGVRPAAGGPAAPADVPAGARRAETEDAGPGPEDAELAEYNAYLARLNDRAPGRARPGRG